MCATFFVFSDYMKYSIRMSAMMKLPVTYIFSHDSIAVGEDGPTHQPIEHLAAIRSIPGIDVYRPSDALETAVAFYHALKQNGPTAIITSRQKLIAHGLSNKEGALKGAYVLSNGTKATPDVILIASGSEVGTCVQAQEVLAQRGISARVVSMPCMEVFDRQSEEYKESVLPKSIRARVAVRSLPSCIICVVNAINVSRANTKLILRGLRVNLFSVAGVAGTSTSRTIVGIVFLSNQSLSIVYVVDWVVILVCRVE